MIKGCNICLCEKLANTCSFVGWHIIMQQEKVSSRSQLDEPVECASGGIPLLLYNILHLLFFPLVQILCALRLESKKFEFQFVWPRACLTKPFRTLLLCFGAIGKTPGLISRNNSVKKNFVCLGHCHNVLARCDLNFPLLRCQGLWNKTCTQLSLSQILFQNSKSLGDI